MSALCWSKRIKHSKCRGEPPHFHDLLQEEAETSRSCEPLQQKMERKHWRISCFFFYFVESKVRGSSILSVEENHRMCIILAGRGGTIPGKSRSCCGTTSGIFFSHARIWLVHIYRKIHVNAVDCQRIPLVCSRMLKPLLHWPCIYTRWKACASPAEDGAKTLEKVLILISCLFC